MRNSALVFILIGLGIVFPAEAFGEDSSAQAIIGSNLSTRTLPTAGLQNIRLSKDYGSVKGWNSLFDLLAVNGFDSNELYSIFTDRRMPSHETLVFNIYPSEKHIPYHKRNNKRERSMALRFLNENQQYFERAELTYSVPSAIILALLQIETRCGTFTGKESVFFQLARLASAASEDSIKESFSFNKRKHKGVTLPQVKTRALWLQNKFLPHVEATIRIAKMQGKSPLDIKGSYGGAIGMPQFLPGHYFNYGVDGNYDGKINLNDPPDAILSVANYLHDNGWKTKNLSQTQKRNVIWSYNHSEPYVTTVLAMANDLEKYTKSPSAAPKSTVVKTSAATKAITRAKR